MVVDGGGLWRGWIGPHPKKRMKFPEIYDIYYDYQKK
jgi:hypothetical protein